MEQLFLSCSVRWSKLFTCLNISSFDCVNVFVQVPNLLASKSPMFASTSSAQLPSCLYDRTFGFQPFCPLCCPNFQRVAFSSRATEQNVARREILETCSTFSVRWFSVGIAETSCRWSPCALPVRESNFIFCLGDIHCFGDCHRPLSLLRFASTLSACHFITSLQLLFFLMT